MGVTKSRTIPMFVKSSCILLFIRICIFLPRGKYFSILSISLLILYHGQNFKWLVPNPSFVWICDSELNVALHYFVFGWLSILISRLVTAIWSSQFQWNQSVQLNSDTTYLLRYCSLTSFTHCFLLVMH